MARVVIPVTALTRDGVAPPAQTNADSVNNMEIDGNDGRVFVEIVSTDAGAQTVSFEIPELVDGEAVAPKIVNVPAGATRLAGPFPTDTYNHAGSKMFVDPSVSGATLKLRAYQLPRE
jgi:hypothetical protein